MSKIFSSKKTIFVLAAMSVVVFSGCKFWPFGGKVLPEAALPKDSHFVMAIDHSDGDQVKNMKKLFEMLPDFGIGKQIEDIMLSDENLKNDGLDYKEDLLPILEGDFKVAFSIDFLKAKDDFKDGGVTVSIFTDEPAKMKNFLDKSKSKKFVYGKDGDFFVFGETQTEIDEALKRLDSGNGFSESDEFKKIVKNSKSNLGYVYLQVDDDVKNFLVGLGYDEKAVTDIYAELVAKEDGFGIEGFSNLSADKDLVAEQMPYFGKKLSLFNKVPLENPILYWEMPEIGQYIGNFLAGFRLGLQGISSNGIIDAQKGYDDLIASIGELAGISKEEVIGILESPFAISIGDSGEKYPTISFAFDVDAKYSDAVKKMTSSFDAYVDAVIAEFDEIIGVKGAFKKDVNVVNGGGLNKLYVDLDAIPPEMLSSFNLIPGLDLKKMKIEIYYGLTGDNVFVIALYPEFNKAYGEKTVGNDKAVSDSIEKMGKDPFDAVFFSPEKLINFIDANYYSLAKNYGILSDDYEKYYATAKDTMQVLKYFVASYSMPTNDKVLFNAFLKFQKVEKDKALEKVKEGK